jgi:hypothetical protein
VTPAIKGLFAYSEDAHRKQGIRLTAIFRLGELTSAVADAFYLAYLRAACASVADFLAALKSSDFNPACALASAVVSLALVAESVVSGIAPFPSF